MRWFRPAQAPLPDLNFTTVVAWYARAVAATSQCTRNIALARVADKHCATGELACGPIGRAPKMAGRGGWGVGHGHEVTTQADRCRPAGRGFTGDRVAGTHRFRPGTAGDRREVEEAIARLGHVRNRAPRSPAPRRTGSIAVVVCEDNSRVFQGHSFRLCSGVSAGSFRARNSACPAHGALAARLPDSISLSAQRSCGRCRTGQHARQKATGSAQPRGARGTGRAAVRQ